MAERVVYLAFVSREFRVHIWNFDFDEEGTTVRGKTWQRVTYDDIHETHENMPARTREGRGTVSAQHSRAGEMNDIR